MAPRDGSPGVFGVRLLVAFLAPGPPTVVTYDVSRAKCIVVVDDREAERGFLGISGSNADTPPREGPQPCSGIDRSAGESDGPLAHGAQSSQRLHHA